MDSLLEKIEEIDRKIKKIRNTIVPEGNWAECFLLQKDIIKLYAKREEYKREIRRRFS